MSEETRQLTPNLAGFLWNLGKMAGNLQRQIRKISVRFVGKMLICKENTHSFSTVSPKIPKNARDTMGRGIVENGGENRKKHRKFSPNSTLRVLECLCER